MASGHVQCRTNRPNTWQLRPAARYQSKPLTARSRPHMAHNRHEHSSKLRRFTPRKRTSRRYQQARLIYEFGAANLRNLGIIGANRDRQLFLLCCLLFRKPAVGLVTSREMSAEKGTSFITFPARDITMRPGSHHRKGKDGSARKMKLEQRGGGARGDS